MVIRMVKKGQFRVVIRIVKRSSLLWLLGWLKRSCEFQWLLE